MNTLIIALGVDNNPEKLMDFIKAIAATYASTDLLQKAVVFKPETSIEEGLQKLQIGMWSIIRRNKIDKVII